MQENESLKTRWKTTAISLSDEYRPDHIVIETNSEVGVKETSRSVDMDSETQRQRSEDRPPYGIPISAELAIALIADLQHRLQKFYAALNQFSQNFAGTENFEKDDFAWLKELLVRSSAITIDKNVLLKTLSQPGCEGVRFYLCRKVVPVDNHSEAPYLSLVTVGVDAVGQDLHYEYDDKKLKGGLKIAELENFSLLSEYGSPPPPETTSDKRFEQFDKRFAILRYALDEAENILTAKAKKQEGK